MPILDLSVEERQKTLRETIESDAQAFFRFLNVNPISDHARHLIGFWQQNPRTVPFQGIGGNIIFNNTRENREWLLGFLVMIEIERIERENSEASEESSRIESRLGELKLQISEVTGQTNSFASVEILTRERNELYKRRPIIRSKILAQGVEALTRTLEEEMIAEEIVAKGWRDRGEGMPDEEKARCHRRFCLLVGTHAISEPRTYPNYLTGLNVTVIKQIFDEAQRGLARVLTSSADGDHDAVGVDGLKLVVRDSAGEAMKSARSIITGIDARENAPRLAAEKERQKREREEARRLEGIAGEAQDFARKISRGNTADELLQMKLQREPFYGIIMDLATCLVKSDPKYANSSGAGRVEKYSLEMAKRIRGLMRLVARNNQATSFPPEYNLLANVIITSSGGVQDFQSYYLGGGVVRIPPDMGYNTFISQKLSSKKIYARMRSYCEERLEINLNEISEQHRALLAMGFSIHPNKPISPDLMEVASCSIGDPQFPMVLKFFRDHGGCTIRRNTYKKDDRGEREYMQACALEMIAVGYSQMRTKMQETEETHFADAPLQREIGQLGGVKTEFFEKNPYAHPAFTLFGNMAIGFRLVSSPEEALQLFADKFIPIPDKLTESTQSLGMVLYGLMPRILAWKGDVRIFFQELCVQVGGPEKFMKMELVEIMMLAIKNVRNGSGQGDEDKEEFDSFDFPEGD